MKLLIINRPRQGRQQADARRFQKMLDAVRLSGISAEYHALQTVKELEQVLASMQPDLVYCANYNIQNAEGKDVSIQQYLLDRKIAYIGSLPESLELVLSKSQLKRKWRKDEVATPSFFTLEIVGGKVQGLEAVLQEGQYPYILKPDREGNSRGLDENSVVNNPAEFKEKAQDLLQKYKFVLVEKFLGRSRDLHEYTVAMIGNGENRLLMPAEIRLKVPKRVRVITTRDKDEHMTQAEPVRDPLLIERLSRFAGHAFDSAQVRDYARCDLLMADNHLYAIEINGLPMIPDLWFEVCARGASLDAGQYLNAIVAAGLIRAKRQGKIHADIPKRMLNGLPESVMSRLANE